MSGTAIRLPAQKALYLGNNTTITATNDVNADAFLIGGTTSFTIGNASNNTGGESNFYGNLKLHQNLTLDDFNSKLTMGGTNNKIELTGTNNELLIKGNATINMPDNNNTIQMNGVNGAINLLGGNSTFTLGYRDGTTGNSIGGLFKIFGQSYFYKSVTLEGETSNLEVQGDVVLRKGADMNNLKITNVADAVNLKDAVNLQQLRAEVLASKVDTGDLSAKIQALVSWLINSDAGDAIMTDLEIRATIPNWPQSDPTNDNNQTSRGIVVGQGGSAVTI